MNGHIGKTWSEVHFGDLVEFFDHKRVPLSGKERSGRQGPFPYYGASGVIDYIDDYIFDGKYLLIAEDGENLRSRKTALAFFGTGKFWVNNHAHIVRAKDGVADDYFLMSYIEASNVSGFITGAAQPKLTQANLKLIPVRLPPLQIQQRIAAILSTYDDLIENNLRRIKILEEMAQAIYREWFVNFRFPGHEKVKMVRLPLGKIPEEWTSSTVGEACQSLVDGDWIETKDQGGKDFRLLQVSNVGVGEFIETGNYRYITKDTFKRLNCTEVLPGQILISRMPKPTGRAWLVTEMPWRMITAVDVAILTPNKDILAPLLFVNILNLPEQLELVAKHSTGTTRERISRSVLSKLPVMLPPLPLQEKFSAITEPCYRQITFLRRKNNILRQTRDLLLPKLISGELDVSELDIKTEDVAA